MDRLLSDDELQECPTDFDGDDPCLGCMQSIAKAQLAKTDKEWWAWGDSRCIHYPEFGLKRECEICWQERKRSIGIESTT